MARKKNIEVTESNRERLSASLVNVQERLNSKYGLKVGLMEDFDMDIRYLSTGSMVLNSLLGGGVAVGRIVEFYGTASSGKTSMALSTIAEAQKNGLTCAFIDVEHAFAKNYARRIGVDVNNLIYSKPYIAEEVFSLAVDLASSDDVDLIVIDSVSAMAATAYSDDDKEITKEQMGIIAQSMSKGLKKLTPACEEHDCACIFINQVRDKTGVMFGNPETTTGGRALEFYASQRVRINRTKIIKGADDEAIGTEVKMEIKKNKTAAPFGVGETVLSFDSGIDKVGEIYVLGVKYKLIRKVGQRFYVNIPVEELTREEQTMLSNYPIEDNFIKIATYEQKTKDAIAEDENLFNVLSNRVVEILMAKQNELAVRNKNDVVELEGEED